MVAVPGRRIEEGRYGSVKFLGKRGLKGHFTFPFSFFFLLKIQATNGPASLTMDHSYKFVKRSVILACLKFRAKLKVDFLAGADGWRVSSHRLALLNITRSLSLSLSLSRWFSFYRSEISLSPFDRRRPTARRAATRRGGRTHRQLCEILLLKGPTTPRVALRFWQTVDFRGSVS